MENNPSQESPPAPGDTPPPKSRLTSIALTLTLIAFAGRLALCGVKNCDRQQSFNDFKRGIGAPCTSGDTCQGGICLMPPMATGSFGECSRSCATAADCPNSYTCESFGKDKACLAPAPPSSQPAMAYDELPLTELEKLCGQDDAGACFTRGMRAHKGEAGAKKDLTAARHFLDKACKLDDPDACNNLGIMVGRGEGGKKDGAEGKRLLIHSCELGFASELCEKLRESLKH